MNDLDTHHLGELAFFFIAGITIGVCLTTLWYRGDDER